MRRDGRILPACSYRPAFNQRFNQRVAMHAATCCRICLDTDEGELTLVRPCLCRGSSAYVHVECLTRWRRTSTRPDACYRCCECLHPYSDDLSLEMLRARRAAEQRAEHPNFLRTSSLLTHELWRQGLQAEAPARRECLLAEAAVLYEDVLWRLRSLRGDDSRDIAVGAMTNLAQLFQSQGRLDDALALCLEALAVCREWHGYADARTVVALNGLGRVLIDMSRLAEAETLFRLAVATSSHASFSVANAQQAARLMSVINLGSLLQLQGRLDEAQPLCQQALQACRAMLGPREPLTLAAMDNLGQLFARSGRFGAAEALFREALDGSVNTLGSSHPMTLQCVTNLRLLLLEARDGARTIGWASAAPISTPWA